MLLTWGEGTWGRERGLPQLSPPQGGVVEHCLTGLDQAASGFQDSRYLRMTLIDLHFKIYYQTAPTEFAPTHRKQSIFPRTCLKVQFGGTDVDCPILGSSTRGNLKILSSSSTERIHESIASAKGGQGSSWGRRIQQPFFGFSGQPVAPGQDTRPSVPRWQAAI